MPKVISKGVGIGKVSFVDDLVFNPQLKVEDVQHEINLYHKAQSLYFNDLCRIENLTSGKVREVTRVHKMFSDDPKVSKEVIKEISENHLSAGHAYKLVIDRYIEVLKQSESEYMLERIDDLLDVKHQMISKMYSMCAFKVFEEDTIIVVNTLYPSLMLNLCPNVKGIIARRGGDLSHAALLAREKQIPYVISNNIDLKPGMVVVLDADQEKIINNPSSDDIKNYQQFQPNMTIDQNKAYLTEGFNLYLNITSPQEITDELMEYVLGIGLYRTEVLVLANQAIPTLEEQVAIYKILLSKAYPKKVAIRLYDFAYDKKPFFLRNINTDTFYFHGALHNIYQEQLEAIMIANEVFGNANITIPMIKSASEIDFVNQALEHIKTRLKLIRDIPNVGIMLETEEAYENLITFKKAKFISIGTNDLSRELYGIDRNDITDYLLHSKMMAEPIKDIHKFGYNHKIPTYICGDLASNPVSLHHLIKTRKKSFSISPASLKLVLTEIDTYLRRTKPNTK